MVQAQLTYVPGSALRWFNCPKMVTHPGTNQAQRRVTALIETSLLPVSQASSTVQSLMIADNRSYQDTS